MARRPALRLAGAIAAACALLAAEQVQLAASWRRLTERAASAGLRLEGRPRARSITTLTVTGVRLSWPATRASALRITALTLARPPLGGGPVTLRLARPVALSGLPALPLDEADALTVLPRASGPIEIRAASLRLPLAATPDPERTLGQLRVTLAAASAPNAVLVTQAGADWLGVRVSATGRLAATADDRIAGELSVTLGVGWRAAIDRAARDGALTPAQARAAAGLLELLSRGGSTVDGLPVAIENGAVTLAGLPLARLPTPTP